MHAEIFIIKAFNGIQSQISTHSNKSLRNVTVTNFVSMPKDLLNIKKIKEYF